MAQSKITLIGMEQYLKPDHSVFENMILPDGIDRDTLISSIILRCQEFELLYTDPEFMTAAVNVWSRKNYWTFDKWVKAINIEYEPLYNYDRTEEVTDTHEGEYSNTGSGSGYGSNTRTDNLLETDDHTVINDLTDANDVTVTHSEKAYNDTNMVDTTKDVTDQDQTHTGTVRTAGTTANTGTSGNQYADTTNSSDSGDDSYTNTHTARMYGNIGVTTSQQMLQSELDLARWNMYEHIADLFASEFCIMIY